MRSATEAACASCVTITTVWPKSSTAWRSRPSTSSEDLESRLPVGSSANTTAGRWISARATATRCCWPPDSSDGRCVRRSPRPTAAISVSCHSLSGLRPASVSGRTMFSSAVSTGTRLKAWKTKPRRSRRRRVRPLSSSVASSLPSTTTEPGARLVEPGEQVHERRLAGAGRAHDRGELAGREADRDAAEGVHGGLALAVDAR